MNMRSNLDKVQKDKLFNNINSTNISEERKNYPDSGCIVDSAKLKGHDKGIF